MINKIKKEKEKNAKIILKEKNKFYNYKPKNTNPNTEQFLIKKNN